MPASSWIAPSSLEDFAAEGTDAHRLCSADDGFVERLGDVALVCFRTERARERLLAELDLFEWQPSRVFARFLARRGEDGDAPVLLRGDASLPLRFEVVENGLRLGLDLEAGPSHGLFLDQRANRARLRREAPGRLLNTFAYTCSMSVAAAVAGSETVSIDLSKKSLQRGRENFRLNQVVEGPRHRFLADDVLEVLPRLARRGESFDAIVLDPPTFSRGRKGRLWRVEDHFGSLVDAALAVAAPAARLLLSTNCATLQAADLEGMARQGLARAGRRGEFSREAALVDFPPGHGATTLWLTLR